MYIKVTENVVDEIFYRLPSQYQFEDGSKTGNFDGMSAVVHRQEGFFPLEDNMPEYDTSYQFVVEDGYQFLEEKIIRNWRVETRDIEALKAEKYTEINNLRDIKISEGFLFNNQLFTGDVATLINITAMAASVALGEAIPEAFSWRAADNSDVVMDAETIKAFALVARNHVYACHLAARQHKLAIEVLESAADVAGYDVQANW